MRRLAHSLLIAGLLLPGVLPQEDARHFQLVLPDFSDEPFDGGTATIDLPPRPIRRLQIQVLRAAERGIGYGSVSVRVNGLGLGNVFDRRANDKGMLLVMNPETLDLRPDQLFDPAENAIEVMAEDRSGRRYYQNWVVRSHAPDAHSPFAHTATISPDDPRGMPPDLVLIEPLAVPVLAPGAPGVAVRLKGFVVGQDVVVSKDGRPWLPAGRKRQTEFDEVVTVPRRQTQIAIEAVDRHGHKRGVVIPIRASAPVQRRPRFAGERWAVVVGVSRFGSQPGSPPLLAGAAADAELFATQLVAKAGFKRENVRLLRDDQATVEGVRVAFQEFAARAQQEDLLIVYLATRGLHDPARPDRLYLTTHGSRMGQLGATAIPLAEWEQWMNRFVRCKQAVFLFDVGHALEGGAPQAGQNLINNHLLNLFRGQEGRAVLVSGGTGEVSRASLFGPLVADGLARNGDADDDGVVTSAELFRYVSLQAQDESKKQQTPQFRVSSSDGTVAWAIQ